MNIATAITLGVVAIILIAIVVKIIKNRKSGKTSCSCGGACKACGMPCGRRKEDNN